jgi:hypothetical protein
MSVGVSEVLHLWVKDEGEWGRERRESKDDRTWLRVETLNEAAGVGDGYGRRAYQNWQVLRAVSLRTLLLTIRLDISTYHDGRCAPRLCWRICNIILIREWYNLHRL